MGKDRVDIPTLEGFVGGTKYILEPIGAYTHRLKWLGKWLVLEDVVGRFDFDCPLQSALAKCLKFGVATCTHKKCEKYVSKISWFARPSPFLSPFVAGAYAHTDLEDPGRPGKQLIAHGPSRTYVVHKGAT